MIQKSVLQVEAAEEGTAVGNRHIAELSDEFLNDSKQLRILPGVISVML
jgi:hypothetical protein